MSGVVGARSSGRDREGAFLRFLLRAVLPEHGGSFGKAVLLGGGQRRDPGLVPGVDVGAARDQQFHQRRPAPGSGVVERSGAGFGIARLPVRALVQQQRGHFARGRSRRRCAVASHRRHRAH